MIFYRSEQKLLETWTSEVSSTSGPTGAATSVDAVTEATKPEKNESNRQLLVALVQSWWNILRLDTGYNGIYFWTIERFIVHWIYYECN